MLLAQVGAMTVMRDISDLEWNNRDERGEACLIAIRV